MHLDDPNNNLTITAWIRQAMLDGLYGVDSTTSFYPELQDLLAEGRKLVIHGEEVGDRLCGLVGGYLLWSAMVPLGPQAISVTERLLTRKMGPVGRGIVSEAGTLAGQVGS